MGLEITDSETQLRQVYAHLGEQIGYETRLIDQSRAWLTVATLLMIIGLGAGISLGRRIP